MTANAAPIAPFRPRARLIHGDCLDEIRTMTRESVDLVLCDLPFGITQAGWDKPIDLGALWQAYSKVLKPTGNVVLFGAQPFSSALVQSAPDLFRYSLIWTKNKSRGHLNAKRRPMAAHEDILIFGRPGGYYHPVMSGGHAPQHEGTNERRSLRGERALYGSVKPHRSRGGATDRYPTSVLYFPVVNNDDPYRIHPTQKPIALLEYLIELYCPTGGWVLDNAMGSGSTIIAAINLGRHAVGIELDGRFFAKAEEWITSESSESTERLLLGG